VSAAVSTSTSTGSAASAGTDGSSVGWAGEAERFAKTKPTRDPAASRSTAAAAAIQVRLDRSDIADPLRSLGGSLCVSPLRRAHAQSAEERHHWAPISYAGLKEIQPYEAGEEQPVRAVVASQQKAGKDESACYQSQCTIDVHRSPPSRALYPRGYGI